MKLFCLQVSLFLSLNICNGTHEVRGRVLSLDNTAIGGVNVLVKGAPFGTATDMTGQFRISVPGGPVVLLFSLLKFQAIEHSFVVRDGYQYHITVFLARKNQSFNKSHSLTGELPLDSPLQSGAVTDQDHRSLAGVTVTEEAANFSVLTDRKGKFTLPVPQGEARVAFTRSGFKSVNVALDTSRAVRDELEVILAENKSKIKSTATFKRNP
jgi:hypothetical protein